MSEKIAMNAETKIPGGRAGSAVMARQAEMLESFLLTLAAGLREKILPQVDETTRSDVQSCLAMSVRLAQYLARIDGADASGLNLSEMGVVPSADAAITMLESECVDITVAEREADRLIATVAAPAIHDRKIERDRIEAYLRSHPRGGGALRLTEARLLSGGRSKQTVLVGVEGAIDLPGTFILRQDWAAAQQEWARAFVNPVETEHALVKRAFDLGLAVPEPLFVEASSDALGASFLAMTLLPGKQVGGIFSPAPSEGMAFQLAEQLAILHRGDTTGLSEIPGIRVRNAPDALRSELARFRGLIARLEVPGHIFAIALDWLDAHVPQNPSLTVQVHGDALFHNLMWDGEKLTALLDWERSALGNPEQDFGYLRTAVEETVDWSAFLAAYAKAGGVPIDDGLVDFYTLYTGVWLYTAMLESREDATRGVGGLDQLGYYLTTMPTLQRRIADELRAILARGIEV